MHEVKSLPAAGTCPSTDQLRQLLSGPTLGDQGAIIGHLDHCASCQKALESLSGASPALLTAAKVLERTPSDKEASLLRVLDALKSDSKFPLLYSALDRSTPVRALLEPVEALSVLGKLDDYEVTEVLGQGGMGLVLKAFDHPLKRWVAIKVLAPDMAGDPLARQRFAREAQAAAAVRHEHIITIHAVSEANGLPFFVMEFVSGGSLQDYLLRHGPPNWRDGARLGAEVAEGLAAAHARGLIHRDIKPSNILLQPVTEPDALGIAKISDFGLAHIIDETRLTQTGIVAGTPMYMAPEQALSEPLDSRADLFSLGSLLYTLCTGKEPFAASGAMAVIRQVCETNPRPMRELNPAIPAWLEALVARLHQKRPSDRFASASEVAELLNYNLTHPDTPRSVPAKPSPSIRSSKRLWIAGASLAVLLLASLIAFRLPWLESVFTPNNTSAVSLYQTLRGHDGQVYSVAFSPDRKLVVSGSDDATLRFWDPNTGKLQQSIPAHNSSLVSVQFTHSGKHLLTGGGDGILRLWEVASRKEIAAWPHQVGSVRRAQISPNDQTVAVSSTTQEIELWDLSAQKLVKTLPGQHGTIQAIAYSPSGDILASGDASGHIRLWDPSTGTERTSFQADPLGLRALAFTPDGETLISVGTGEKDIKLWRVKDQERITALGGFTNEVLNITISSDGRLLTTGARDGTVRIWDLNNHSVLAIIQAHQGTVWAVTFSKDRQFMATAGEDRVAKLWDLRKLSTVLR